MPYYETLNQDLIRAREILARGREEMVIPGGGRNGADYVYVGCTIYATDTYAAYKLLESFVTEIERLTAGDVRHGQITDPTL